MPVKGPIIWLVFGFLVIHCSAQPDLYDYNYDRDYFEDPPFLPEQPVDKWIRLNETWAKAMATMATASKSLQMKEQEKIEQENKEIKKHLSSCWKAADKDYNENSHWQPGNLVWHAQHKSAWLNRKKDCERRFQVKKLPIPCTSQNQMDNELITKPSFIRELLSGLDDRDFQLRSQNQAIKKAIEGVNEALNRKNQAILKRVRRLERQVKGCKCKGRRRQQKAKRTSSSEEETHSRERRESSRERILEIL